MTDCDVRQLTVAVTPNFNRIVAIGEASSRGAFAMYDLQNITERNNTSELLWKEVWIMSGVFIVMSVMVTAFAIYHK